MGVNRDGLGDASLPSAGSQSFRIDSRLNVRRLGHHASWASIASPTVILAMQSFCRAFHVQPAEPEVETVHVQRTVAEGLHCFVQVLADARYLAGVDARRPR